MGGMKSARGAPHALAFAADREVTRQGGDLRTLVPLLIADEADRRKGHDHVREGEQGERSPCRPSGGGPERKNGDADAHKSAADAKEDAALARDGVRSGELAREEVAGGVVGELRRGEGRIVFSRRVSGGGGGFG